LGSSITQSLLARNDPQNGVVRLGVEGLRVVECETVQLVFGEARDHALETRADA
jgi:hypothetical protein